MRLVVLEPFGEFVSPRRKIAHFGDAAILAGDQQHVLECRPVIHHTGWQRKHAVKRLVRKCHAMRRIELGHANGKLVEHRALGFAEGAKFACLLFHFLDIYRVAGDAFADEWKIGDTHRATRPVDRGAHDPFDRLPAIGCLLRDLRCGSAVHRFNEVDLVGDDLIGAFRTDCSDISLVDEAQMHVRTAEPHRHGSGFDQAHECAEIFAGARRFLAQLGQLGFALAEIEYPDQGRAPGRHCRIGQGALHCERLARPRRYGDGHPKRAGRFLGTADIAGEFFDLVFAQPVAVGACQFAEVVGHLFETDPASQPVRRLDPSIGPHQHRDGGAFLDHAGKALRRLAAGDGFLFAPGRAQHHPDGACGP